MDGWMGWMGWDGMGSVWKWEDVQFIPIQEACLFSRSEFGMAATCFFIFLYPFWFDYLLDLPRGLA
jgi:hypothetical protein